MKFEINIKPEIEEEVVNQVTNMHHIALHNLGNSIVRGGDVESAKKVAEATKIVYDIVMVVTQSLNSKALGEDPDDYSFGNEASCYYVSE